MSTLVATLAEKFADSATSVQVQEALTNKQDEEENTMPKQIEHFINSTIGQIPVQHYVSVARDFMNNFTAYTVSYDPTNNYQISLLAKYLHRVPRFDVDLRSVNSTFDPYNSGYWESLGIWIAIPGFWLVLTLLLFLIFFICRCCAISHSKFDSQFYDADEEILADADNDDCSDESYGAKKRAKKIKKNRGKESRNCCSRFLLFLLAILTVATISFGLYGCLQMQIGMYQLQNSMNNITHTVNLCQNHTLSIQSSMNSILKDSLLRLNEMQFLKQSNQPGTRSQAQQTIIEYLKSANDSQRLIQFKIDNVERELYIVGLDNLSKLLEKIEDFRQPLSIVLIALLMFINMILIYGICCNSRCFLLMYGIFGLMAIIICWLCVSLYLGLTIVTADFCHNPQPFFIPHQQQPRGEYTSTTTHAQEIFDHYLYCLPGGIGDHQPPLFQRQTTQKPVGAVRELEQLFTAFADKTIALQQYCASPSVSHNQGEGSSRGPHNGLNCPQVGQHLMPVSDIISRSSMSLTYVRNQLSCNPLHSYYVSGMTGLCKTAFEGAFYTLLVMVFGGLLFTLLVLSSSQLWISIRKRRSVGSLSIVDGGPNNVSKVDVFADNEIDPFLPSSQVSTGGSSSQHRRTNAMPMSNYGVMPGHQNSSRPSAPTMLSQARSRVNDENLAFLSPPPAYDHLQQQQMSHHHQMTYGNTGTSSVHHTPYAAGVSGQLHHLQHQNQQFAQSHQPYSRCYY